MPRFSGGREEAGEEITRPSISMVPREAPGVSVGPEEHKLGIRGSSTRQVILEDAPVPVDRVLGEVGQGHKIAFNILNIGRWKWDITPGASVEPGGRVSDEERLSILKMLQEKKITVEEAEQLLAALEGK